MLNILSFFSTMEDAPYCIVKLPDTFPSLKRGEDVDIFCYSTDEFARKLLSWGNRYVGEGCRICVREVYGKSQVHVDFMKGATLEVRFDLYEELPSYRKVEIRPALFESIIENSRSLAFDDGNVSANVRVPSEIDEMLVRYLEFIEWYDVRPDKIRHLDYILRAGDDVAQRRLVEKLHHYTKIPPVRAPEIKKGSTFVGSVRGLWERFFRR